MCRERPVNPAFKAEGARRGGLRAARPWAPFFILNLALSLFTPAHARAAGPALADPVQLLAALNKLSVDPSQVYFLRDARLTRDRVTFYFNRGFLGLFTQVDGEVTGAAYVGDGEVLMLPPDPVERQSLAWFTKSPALEERFSSIFLRFTDSTAQELLAKARIPDPALAEQPAGLVPAWNDAIEHLAPRESLRVLEDLVSEHRSPYFHASVEGLSLGPFSIIVDERRPEAVQVAAPQTKEGVTYSDVWCSFKSLAQSRTQTGGRGAWLPPVQVHSYRIETRIKPDKTLEGHAELDLEARTPDRFLAFEMSPLLEVSQVRDERGANLAAFQGPLGGVRKPAERNSWVAVVLPKAHPPGERFRLIFTYRGAVIADAGNGVLYVGAHESWYPNLAFGRATYDLTFEYPERLTLVATGRCVQDSSSAGSRHSHWVSDGVLPMAGFNLGLYDSRTRDLGNVRIQVFADAEAEASLERRFLQAQAEAEARAEAEAQAQFGALGQPRAFPPELDRLSPSALIGTITDAAASTVGYYQSLFGPFPYPQLAISQIPGSFGQGWPGLVYLPTFVFLPASVLAQMGSTAGPENLEDRLTLKHEVAHQWWGNLVGWRTYHDQWLSEGFASYAAALDLARGKDGDKLFRQLLQDYRHDLLAKDEQGATVESAGPIWLGARLNNSLDPHGYDAIVYKKACWVIHMLRLLLTDPATGSDARFFQMLRGFISTYRGQDASTEDFVAYAEKYITSTSDLDRDHKLNWFFNEWVYSTGLPEYELKTSIGGPARGVYLVEGNITQSGVSPSFDMLVPIKVSYGAGARERQKSKRVLVPVSGSGGRFHFTSAARPERIAIDQDAILAVVHP